MTRSAWDNRPTSIMSTWPVCRHCAQVRPAHGSNGECPITKPDLAALLALHYVTAIECDHELKTDTIRCNCSVWTGTPQPSVGAAVQQWIDHVLGLLR